MRPEALQYLQRRLDDVRNVRLLRLDRERPDVVASSLASAGGALEALRGVGLISHDELTEWNARFWEAVTGEAFPSAAVPTEKAATATSSVTETVGAVTAARVPGADVPPPPTRRFQAIGFRRLVPGPNEEKPFGPGVLRILALFVFDDGVEVDWLFRLPPDWDALAAERDDVADDLDALPSEERIRRLHARDSRLRFAATPHEFGLSDDVGTLYRPQGGGAHGGPANIRGIRTFTPTLPREATRLDVAADGATFTVPLS